MQTQRYETDYDLNQTKPHITLLLCTSTIVVHYCESCYSFYRFTEGNRLTQLMYTGWPEKLAQFLYALTLPNINLFPKTISLSESG